MTKIPELFGSMVFGDAVMRERLPQETYSALKKTISEGKPLDPAVADVVANAMKDWAEEKGATHYTHWFQPMTGITAEKHESFISPTDDGSVILKFSGKALIQGEPDASSFPSGGLRATFEARGYTSWDPTSYAFIKDGTLCIPTAFYSYTGEALDQKTPLLRSMEAINKQALRVLRLFGSDARRVFSTTGAEQEYFIVDREKYNGRKDLIYTGRTLFGARPPKGQELDDHYFGSIKIRISAFMKELNEELWKLGVLSKTEHNEAAPAQHELAPIFTTSNIAADHNQLVMEMMRKVAKRHGLTCLLHEKPFARVNGSGKHNNWSLTTDTGVNLLDPGTTPHENAQFLLFFCAVIKAVDTYPELLRIAVASSANDHRLGGHEAPPAIISIFTGEEIESIFNAIEKGEEYDAQEAEFIELGVDELPNIPKDTTDRNRTSPFAFTGNRFEFRSPGSSMAVAGITATINTIVADALCDFADELENAEDFNKSLRRLIKRTVKEHKRIVFNGNGYDDAWVQEAARRGLPNLVSTPDAVPHLLDEKNVTLFTKHGVYSERELVSRCEIQLEAYNKSVNIEARTMLEMAKTDILPLVYEYSKVLAETITAKRTACPSLVCGSETDLLTKISTLSDRFYAHIRELEELMEKAAEFTSCKFRELSVFYRGEVLPKMAELREVGDSLEVLVAGKYWPYPSYGTLLYRV